MCVCVCLFETTFLLVGAKWKRDACLSGEKKQHSHLGKMITSIRSCSCPCQPPQLTENSAIGSVRSEQAVGISKTSDSRPGGNLDSPRLCRTPAAPCFFFSLKHQPAERGMCSNVAANAYPGQDQNTPGQVEVFAGQVKMMETQRRKVKRVSLWFNAKWEP